MQTSFVYQENTLKFQLLLRKSENHRMVCVGRGLTDHLVLSVYLVLSIIWAALSPFSTQPVFVLEVAPTHVQDSAFGLVGLHGVHTDPPLKPVQVPGVTSKLAEGALNTTVHVADKNIIQHWSQYPPLRKAACHWSPLGHQATDRKSMGLTSQPVPSGPSIKSVSCQYRDKKVVQGSVKCFAQVQVDNIRCPSLIHQRCNLSQCLKPQIYPNKGMVGHSRHLAEKRNKNTFPGCKINVDIYKLIFTLRCLLKPQEIF